MRLGIHYSDTDEITAVQCQNPWSKDDIPRFECLDSIGWSSFSQKMAVAALSPSPPLSHLSMTRTFFFHSSRPLVSSTSLYSFSAFRPIHPQRPKLREILSRRPPPLWRVSGINSNAVDGAQEIVPAAGDGSGYSIVSALLFIAFIGLSILTIGVILSTLR